MSVGDSGFAAVILLLVAGNVAYLLGTLILSEVLGVLPTGLFSGPFLDLDDRFVNTWVAIGALLVFADLAAVLSFISSAASGW